MSSSSSAGASSPLTSASWGSSCSLSRRCWPPHARWKPSAPRGHCGSGARPPPPPPPSLSSASQSLSVSMPPPAASRTCTAPSPRHPAVSLGAEASQAGRARRGGARWARSPMMLSNSAGHCRSPWTLSLFRREISYLIFFFCFLCFESMRSCKSHKPCPGSLGDEKKILYWVSSSAWSSSLSIPILLSCFLKKDTPPLLPIFLPRAHLG